MNTQYNELDLLIAENIFGIKHVYYFKYEDGLILYFYIPSGKPWKTHHIDSKPLPSYSGNPSHTYGVMMEATDKYHWVIKSPFTRGGEWFAGLTPYGVTGWNGKPDFSATGKTMQEAVCKCILTTVTITHELKKTLVTS